MVPLATGRDALCEESTRLAETRLAETRLARNTLESLRLNLKITHLSR